MGTVIRFPVERVTSRKSAGASRPSGETASIIILPVVRIERWAQKPRRSLPEKTSQATKQ
jgi:hypothetical protein